MPGEAGGLDPGTWRMPRRPCTSFGSGNASATASLELVDELCTQQRERLAGTLGGRAVGYRQLVDQ
jgi:hypothetical protein